jgi:hypothetical protein
VSACLGCDSPHHTYARCPKRTADDLERAVRAPVESVCKHCTRRILYEAGVWIDPEAPATPEAGDDHIWRATCDSSPAFTAEHEPVAA